MVETAMGIYNREMGLKLCISYQTIKNHKSNIYVKLNVSGAAEAVALLMATDDEFYAEIKRGFEERKDERWARTQP